jgi:hypothetical protein
MITAAAFPLFARRKRPTATQPRNLKDEPKGRRGLHFWHRRELSTFQKCLAVHMYYASAERGRRS